MKQLILDFAKWRAGGNDVFHDNKNMIGHGRTSLLNEQGFMCCLGQWSLQCGFNEDEIKGNDEPCELEKYFDQFNYKDEWGIFHTTNLGSECIKINDDYKTTWKQKIIALHELLKKNNIQLIVINTPEPIYLNNDSINSTSTT